MVYLYDENTRARAELLIQGGYSSEEVIKQTNVSGSTFRRWRSEVNEKGVLNLKPHPRNLTDNVEPDVAEALLEYLAERPDANYCEIGWFLYDEFGIVTAFPGIDRLLARNGWTRDFLFNLQARYWVGAKNEWHNTIKDITSAQVVFVGESSGNRRAADRRYGWSHLDFNPTKVRSVNRNERWTILPAYTIDGYLPGYLIVQGEVSKEMFLHWLQYNVLPYCSPYPGPRSILVMDHAEIHRCPEVEQLCAAHKTVLLHLPPFSRELNAVELSLLYLKSELRRRRYEYEDGDFPDFGVFLRACIDEAIGILGYNNVLRTRRATTHFHRARILGGNPGPLGATS